MESNTALKLISNIKRSVRIQKLSRTTNLRDLSPTLLQWLGTSKHIENDSVHHDKFRLVGDLDHDIWMCRVGHEVGYGKSFAESVLACDYLIRCWDT